MKLVLAFMITATALFGVDGYEVYKKNCMQCHIENITKAETLKRFKTLSAPPMVEVANQLRKNIIIGDDDDDVKRFVTISFIKEYIQHPALDYSMCHPMAIERFGIMPPQPQLNEAERQAVAEWIIDNYVGKSFK